MVDFVKKTNGNNKSMDTIPSRMVEEEVKPTTNIPKVEVSKDKETLPVYDDIRYIYDLKEFTDADRSKMKYLLAELCMFRALDKNKGIKKALATTYDNKRSSDGTVTKLVGVYCTEDISDREADDLIISSNPDLTKMWVVQKYNEILDKLK